MPLLQIDIDDRVIMKKQHPCGGSEWKVTRVGADIGLVCLTCDRRILIARRELEQRLKKIIKADKPL